MEHADKSYFRLLLQHAEDGQFERIRERVEDELGLVYRGVFDGSLRKTGFVGKNNICSVLPKKKLKAGLYIGCERLASFRGVDFIDVTGLDDFEWTATCTDEKDKPQTTQSVTRFALCPRSEFEESSPLCGELYCLSKKEAHPAWTTLGCRMYILVVKRRMRIFGRRFFSKVYRAQLATKAAGELTALETHTAGAHVAAAEPKHSEPETAGHIEAAPEPETAGHVEAAPDPDAAAEPKHSEPETAGHIEAAPDPDAAAEAKHAEPETAGHVEAAPEPETAGHIEAAPEPETAGHVEAAPDPDAAAKPKHAEPETAGHVEAATDPDAAAEPKHSEPETAGHVEAAPDPDAAAKPEHAEPKKNVQRDTLSKMNLSRLLLQLAEDGNFEAIRKKVEDELGMIYRGVFDGGLRETFVKRKNIYDVLPKKKLMAGLYIGCERRPSFRGVDFIDVTGLEDLRWRYSCGKSQHGNDLDPAKQRIIWAPVIASHRCFSHIRGELCCWSIHHAERSWTGLGCRMFVLTIQHKLNPNKSSPRATPVPTEREAAGELTASGTHTASAPPNVDGGAESTSVAAGELAHPDPVTAGKPRHPEPATAGQSDAAHEFDDDSFLHNVPDDFDEDLRSEVDEPEEDLRSEVDEPEEDEVDEPEEVPVPDLTIGGRAKRPRTGEATRGGSRDDDDDDKRSAITEERILWIYFCATDEDKLEFVKEEVCIRRALAESESIVAQCYKLNDRGPMYLRFLSTILQDARKADKQFRYLHFSGHGRKGLFGTLELGPDESKRLASTDNEPTKTVPTHTGLANIVASYQRDTKASLRGIFLNCCHGITQAEYFHEYADVPWIVAHDGEVKDSVAISFAGCFWGGIATGSNESRAFNEAVNNVSAMTKEHKFKLISEPRPLECPRVPQDAGELERSWFIDQQYDEDERMQKQYDSLMSSVTEPMKLRDYQVEMLRACRQRNTLCCLPTGAGKSLVAFELMCEFIEDSRKWPLKVAFLTPTVPLMFQQSRAFQRYSMKYGPDDIGKYCGDECNITRDRFASKRAVFFTGGLFFELLKRRTFALTDFSMVCFDEAHHAKGAFK